MSRRVELVFLLFMVSGFGGLIYESVWTHYLRLFLGASAYAQTLVLVVFIGGLALGAWICARFARRFVNPLRWYAASSSPSGSWPWCSTRSSSRRPTGPTRRSCRPPAAPRSAEHTSE